jgi:hypothetical protein
MALAELMGIILNDGYRRPTIRVRRLGFGVGTPYHMLLERVPEQGDPVKQALVARLLRKVLTEIVEHGTAREDACAARLRVRLQLHAMMLRHGRHYQGKNTWSQAHDRHLSTIRFEHPAQELAFNEYRLASKEACERVERIT